jgi:hypothetical protein
MLQQVMASLCLSATAPPHYCGQSCLGCQAAYWLRLQWKPLQVQMHTACSHSIHTQDTIVRTRSLVDVPNLSLLLTPALLPLTHNSS